MAKRRRRKHYDQEMRMLREIAWDLLLWTRCVLCNEPLIPLAYTEKRSIRFGNRKLAPFKFKLTLHHKNGNHEDNSDANRAWVHYSCHKSYHMKLSQAEMKTWEVSYEPESETEEVPFVVVRAKTEEDAERNAMNKYPEIDEDTILFVREIENGKVQTQHKGSKRDEGSSRRRHGVRDVQGVQGASVQKGSSRKQHNLQRRNKR